MRIIKRQFGSIFLIALVSLVAILSLASCSSVKKQPALPTADLTPTVAEVLEKAFSYMGSPYRYGGNSYSGLDCSGLVQLSFAQAGIKLPRTSQAQSRSGQPISRANARVGDLIFFNTQSNKISHVGIVTEISNNTLSFIHVSESRGVIVSSSDNIYWKPRFNKVIRVIE